MDEVTSCIWEQVNGRDCCQSCRAGHNMHWGRASELGRRPWGWRNATVTHVTPTWITLHYTGTSTEVRVWHHNDLSSEITVGERVRLHEEYLALGGPFGWIYVVVHGGLGPVPKPANPQRWAAQTTGGVVSLATGRALAGERPLGT